MGAAGRTGVTWQEQERNGHQEHGRPGPLSWHMKHECEHEQYFGKIATEAANMSMFGAALPWASDHNQFQRDSPKHRTQRNILQSLSPWWAREGPDQGGKEINENVPKQGLGHDRAHQRNPPTLVLWTSLKNPNGLTLPEQGTGLLQGFSCEREASAGRFSGHQCSPAESSRWEVPLCSVLPATPLH